MPNPPSPVQPEPDDQGPMPVPNNHKVDRAITWLIKLVGLAGAITTTIVGHGNPNAFVLAVSAFFVAGGQGLEDWLEKFFRK